MVSIKNIEKFLEDHPELSDKKYQILGRADALKSKNGVIFGGSLDEIFTDKNILDLFCAEIASAEHLKLAHGDIIEEVTMRSS